MQVALGANGLGLISYADGSNNDLKVGRCVDTLCTSVADVTIDSARIVGTDSSIALGVDGLGLVSYFDFTQGDLKVAHLGIGVP